MPLISLKCNHNYVPTVKHQNDVGFDLYTWSKIEVPKFKSGVYVFYSGVFVEYIHHGYWLQILDKSGVFAKKQLHIGAGVIDTSYKGELGVALINFSQFDLVIPAGTPIAQVIIRKAEYPSDVVSVNGTKLEVLEDKERKADGGLWR